MILQDTILENQQETRREYPICDWCGKEIIGKRYGIQLDYSVEEGMGYFDGSYHQNCAYEYCKSKGR